MGTRLSDTVAVVTGGSSSLGRAIALRYAEEGAAVVIGDVRREPKPDPRRDDALRPTDTVIRERGGDATFLETDVGDPDQCEALIETAVEAFDGVDVLVNNAGIVGPLSMAETEPDDWQRVVSTNLSGAFFCAKFAIPYLRERPGSIINIGSVKGTEGGAGPSYSATKAAVINLTRDLATEHGADGIRVNAICPGPVWTGNWAAMPEDAVQAAREQIVLPRFGEPSDIAHAAVFLASAEAEWVTGEAFFVDGGATAHR